MTTAVPLASFSSLHTLQYPTSDTGSPAVSSFPTSPSCATVSNYLVKIPVPPFSTGDNYKKGSLSSEMVVQLPCPNKWKSTVYNGKVRQKSTFFFHYVSCYVEMVSVERTGEADTGEACCPLLVPSALDLTAASWSFSLSQKSPAGEEERKLLYRLNWLFSTAVFD